MKLVEIKELSISDLEDQIRKSKIELVDLRMKLASRQLQDSSSIKKKRKEIARLLTMQTEKSGKDTELAKETEVDSKQKKKTKKKEKISSSESKTVKKTKGVAKKTDK